mmetsp:Transcript_2644/g.6825  ORF Transcript_2644/g.6825 Transcript_2644/m.6825 type:complete len:564 (-) Transcript_2644:226-1917(-)
MAMSAVVLPPTQTTTDFGNDFDYPGMERRVPASMTRPRTMPAGFPVAATEVVKSGTATAPVPKSEACLASVAEERADGPRTDRSDTSMESGPFTSLFGSVRRTLTRMSSAKTWHPSHEGPMLSTRSATSVASQSTEASPRNIAGATAPSSMASIVLLSPAESQTVLPRADGMAVTPEAPHRLPTTSGSAALGEVLREEVYIADQDLVEAKADAERSRDDLENLLELMRRRMNDFLQWTSSVEDHSRLEAEARKDRQQIEKALLHAQIDSEKRRLAEVRAQVERAQKEMLEESAKRSQMEAQEQQQQEELKAKLQEERRRIQEEQERLARAAADANGQEGMLRSAKEQAQAQLEAERAKVEQERLRLEEAKRKLQEDAEQRKRNQALGAQQSDAERSQIAKDIKELEQERARLEKLEKDAERLKRAEEEEARKLAVAKSKQLEAERKKLLQERERLSKAQEEARIKASRREMESWTLNVTVRDALGKTVVVSALGGAKVYELFNQATSQLQVRNPTNYGLFLDATCLPLGLKLIDAKLTDGATLRLRPKPRLVFQVSPHFSVIP